MRKIFKTLLLLFGFLTILFASLIGKEIGKVTGKVASPPTTHQSEQQLIEGLEEAANQINKKVPILIDDETRLDKVSIGPGARIN